MVWFPFCAPLARQLLFAWLFLFKKTNIYIKKCYLIVNMLDDFDDKLINSVKRKVLSRLTPRKRTNILGEEIRPFYSSRKKQKDLLNLAKGSVFFPFTQPTVVNPFSGRKIQGHMPGIKTDMFSMNQAQAGEVITLFFTGNIPPSRMIQHKGYVFGFSSLQFAKGWKQKNRYANIWQFLTDDYSIDKKRYLRKTDTGLEMSDNEFIARSVLNQKMVE